MQLIGTILLLVILILIGVTVGGGILVLVAYGLGWLLNLDPFQATLLSLAGMLAFGFLASRIFQTILDTISPSHVTSEDDEDDDEDEGETEFKVEAVDKEPVIYPSIPRRRQPLKTTDFSNTQIDDRCLCGSGRKYKNYHGAKRSAA